MACRGFLQCTLKVFNLLLAIVGVLLLVFSLSLYAKYSSQTAPPSPPSAPPSPTTLHRSLVFQEKPSGNMPGVPHVSFKGSSPLKSKRAHAASSPSRRLSHFFFARHGSPKLHLPDLWFIYLLIGTGCFITLLTVIGAIAAETNSGCCLSTYQFGLCLLLLLQCVAAALIWLKEVPVDPTRTYDDERDFVIHNLDLCRMAGVCLLLVEGTALLLAMLLRAIQVDSIGLEDDEDLAAVAPSPAGRGGLRQPFLRQMQYPPPGPSQVLGHGSYPSSASTSPPFSHVGGHVGPSANFQPVGVVTSLGNGSAGGINASSSQGQPMAEAWRSRLFEKYGLDVNDYQVAGDRQPVPAIAVEETRSSSQCTVM